MAHKEIKPRGYWDDYDNCYNEAKKYTSRAEFKKKSPGACKSARKHKWLNDYTWLKRPKPANIKWDDIALVMQEGSKYYNKKEFHLKMPGAYKAALRFHILDLINFQGEQPEEMYNPTWCVYGYINDETKEVYFGLTRNFKRRMWEHHTNHTNKKKNSKLHSVLKENGAVSILKDGLTAKEAQYYEDIYKNEYIKKGYTSLSTGSTGVGVGSIGYCKDTVWTREKCYEEAKKYRTREDFHKYSSGAYGAAYKNNWLDDYTWFVNGTKLYWDEHRKWTRESCYNEAKKYKTILDFRTNANGAYQEACKNGWSKDYVWLVNGRTLNSKWNYKTCFELAKQCKSKTEMKKKSNRAYQLSRENGWLDIFFPCTK